MRPIKYRAWLRQEQEMTYDFKVMSLPYWENKYFIVMQYTGFNDKNGVEIYEGDIVDSEYGYLGEVKFSDSSGWTICSGVEGTPLAVAIECNIKVIGNIFENEHLYLLELEEARKHFNTQEWETVGNIYQNEHLIEK